MTGLIFNQNKIPREKWRYGLRSSAATGCGWIAVHNALWLMGYDAKPEKLIRYFERRLPLINGNFGTFILNLAGYFRRRGFRVKLSLRRGNFDHVAENSDACILFYYWRKKLHIGAHYTALRYHNGRFVGYNTFHNSAGPDDYGESLEAFLRKHRYFGTILISIKDKRARH